MPRPILTTQMKSVGEAMAMGRTWQESFNKALRSLETGLSGWGLNKNDGLMQNDPELIKERLVVTSRTCRRPARSVHVWNVRR